MARKKDRIILDTNIWVSFLISDSFSGLDKLINSNQVELLFCDELLQEFIEVVRRPKFRKFISEPDLLSLLSVISQKGVFVDIHSSVLICRDQKDNFLLALGKDGKATHLITGDKDLLALKKFEVTKIQTYSTYIAEK